MSTIEERLERIEEFLRLLVKQKTVKAYYTTAEVAEILGRAEWTVREWCRTGRVNAEKRPCGRGKSQEFEVVHGFNQRIVSTAGRMRSSKNLG